MKLTQEQHNRFDKDGYLFFPSLFSHMMKLNILLKAVPELYERREEYNYREKGSDAVRTNFAAHLYSKPFAKLSHHPRMIKPVEELLGEQVCICINLKSMAKWLLKETCGNGIKITVHG